MKMLTYGALVFAGGAALLAGTFDAARTPPAADRASDSQFVGSEEDRRHAEELDAIRLVVIRRYEVKLEATRALIRGQITLRDAARRFREATACDPAAEGHLRRAHPGVPDSELYYRNVLDFIAGELMDSPKEAAAVLAAQQAELERILQDEAGCPCGEEL